MLGMPAMFGAAHVPAAAGVDTAPPPEDPEDEEPDDPEEDEDPDPDGDVGVSRFFLLENSQPPPVNDAKRISGRADLVRACIMLVIVGMSTLGRYSSVPARTFPVRADSVRFSKFGETKDGDVDVQNLRQFPYGTRRQSCVRLQRYRAPSAPSVTTRNAPI